MKEIEKNTSINNSLINKKNIIRLNSFWIGFIIYILCYTLYFTPSGTNILHAIQIPAVILIVVSAISLFQFKIENKYLRGLFPLYICWSVLTIIRGFTTASFKEMLYDSRYGMLLYLTPLIILFPLNKIFYKKLISTIIVFGFFYILFDIFFIKVLLSSSQDTNNASQNVMELFSTLSIPSGFILLTHYYHSKKINLFALFVVIISFFLAIIRARRGLIFMYSSFLLCSYILDIFSSNKKFIVIYLAILISLVGALYVSNIYKIGKNSIFTFLLDRGDEDTRTGVELYFYDDMKTEDWIIGKGINAEYFCPDIEPGQTTNYRTVIETDYLQTILNGGIISLALLLLIVIPAIFLGLFYSTNILSKSAALWIFLWVLSLYPSRVTAFSLHYLTVWISIAICYSKSIRNMSETSMKKLFT